MLRLLIDQNLNHDILRGLRLRIPGLDFVTARQAALHLLKKMKFAAKLQRQKFNAVYHLVWLACFCH